MAAFTTPPTFRELERAASDVIRIAKQIPELGSVKLAIVGGLAMSHHLPQGRTTDNINFITGISTSPGWLKNKLLMLPGSPLVKKAQILFYVDPGSGREVQVDIMPEWLAPFLPEAAKRVRHINIETDGEGLPYISLPDLIIFKLDSSGLRSNAAKKQRDAIDAAALLERATAATPSLPLPLSPEKREIAHEALLDVVRYSGRGRAWWEMHLGLSGHRGGDAAAAAAGAGASLPAPSFSRIMMMSLADVSSTAAATATAPALDTARAAAGSGISRPHSNSAPETYDGYGVLGGAADASRSTSSAWFYERLDTARAVRPSGCAHHHHPRGCCRHRCSGPRLSRSSSELTMTTSSPPSPLSPVSPLGSASPFFQSPSPVSYHNNINNNSRPGGYRHNSSSSSSRDRSRSGSFNRRPKTTDAAARRSSLKKSVSFDSGYDSDCGYLDGEYCFLEPAGSARPPQAREAPPPPPPLASASAEEEHPRQEAAEAEAEGAYDAPGAAAKTRGKKRGVSFLA